MEQRSLARSMLKRDRRILGLIHPFFSTSDLTKLRNINFLDFSMFDALDACLMVHGSWLMAHGSWLMAHGSLPREARGDSWLMAHGQGGPAPPWGPRERQVRPGPGPALPRASGSGRPPLAMSHEP